MVALTLMEGNTASVAAAVLAGHAELGCIEGDSMALAADAIAIADPTSRATPAGAPTVIASFATASSESARSYQPR